MSNRTFIRINRFCDGEIFDEIRVYPLDTRSTRTLLAVIRGENIPATTHINVDVLRYSAANYGAHVYEEHTLHIRSTVAEMAAALIATGWAEA